MALVEGSAWRRSGCAGTGSPVSGAATERETYARAKATLAIVVSPPARRELQ